MNNHQQKYYIKYPIGLMLSFKEPMTSRLYEHILWELEHNECRENNLTITIPLQELKIQEELAEVTTEELKEKISKSISEINKLEKNMSIVKFEINMENAKFIIQKNIK